MLLPSRFVGQKYEGPNPILCTCRTFLPSMLVIVPRFAVLPTPQLGGGGGVYPIFCDKAGVKDEVKVW